MNQDQNNLNQNDFNTQGNNGIPNHQPLQNNQGLNNIFGQNINVNQPTYSQPIQDVSNVYSQDQMNNTNIYQQPVTSQSNFNNDQNTNKRKNKKIKSIIIAIVALLVIIIGITIFSKVFLNNKDSNEPIEVSSTFEKDGTNYVLKDETGKILLDNIKTHGEFCNGTTEVQSTNGEYGIINGSGKFMVEYGRYADINQYSSFGGVYYCFYQVTDKNTNNYQKYILKYDGNILVKDDKDKYLKEYKLTNYVSSVRYALLETKNEYKFLNYLGDTLLSIDKVSSLKEPTIIANGARVSNDQYVSLFYDNKTYIFDLEKGKQILSAFDGTFKVNSIDDSKSTTYTIAGVEYKKGIETIIIFGRLPDGKTPKTYIVNKGKITYETSDCLNAHMINGEVRCLIQNGGIYKYFDINGKEIAK